MFNNNNDMKNMDMLAISDSDMNLVVGGVANYYTENSEEAGLGDDLIKDIIKYTDNNVR